MQYLRLSLMPGPPRSPARLCTSHQQTGEDTLRMLAKRISTRTQRSNFFDHVDARACPHGTHTQD